ncbi:MAG: PhzF family phenazine biosynthesis protein [Acidobacteria bacterium]|nr:MAG: PhzF family phenazine biosynthesis protein [Acidobacteriota bacterium]
MPVVLFHVDAFTDVPFRGNPAAVCLLDEPRDAEWMQQVAHEMNLSETAFVAPAGETFSLRWFTPEVEVHLCGHATLASAHVLWETGRLPVTAAARFETLSGVLDVRLQADGWIALDFPAILARPGAVPDSVVEALGVVPIAMHACGPRWLVEVESEKIVRGLAPDFTRMRSVLGRAVIVTARSDDPSHDFISRYFAPWVGVNEDPVTGVAHCCLGPYWGPRLGKTVMTAYQASARGGTVRVEVRGGRVLLSGQAVTVAEGELRSGEFRGRTTFEVK